MKALDLRKKKKEDLDKELIELRKAQFSLECKYRLNNRTRTIN